MVPDEEFDPLEKRPQQFRLTNGKNGPKFDDICNSFLSLNGFPYFLIISELFHLRFRSASNVVMSLQMIVLVIGQWREAVYRQTLPLP